MKKCDLELDRKRLMKNVIGQRFIQLIFMTGLVFGSAPGWADDGQIEINQVCAVQMGCTSGDSPGFPVTLDGSAGASHILTSDLVVPLETDGIVFSASGSAIDLNGFRIVRSGCETSTTDCTPALGTGDGISGALGVNGVSGISVRNGSVVGMAKSGISLGRASTIENVRARWNAFFGITLSSGSSLTGSVAYQNGSAGVQVYESTVRSIATARNQKIGLRASSSQVSGVTAYQNGEIGFRIGSSFGARLIASSAYGNGLASPRASQYGIGLNTLSVNFCASGANGGTGITNGSGGVITHSASFANQFDGMIVSTSLVTGNASQNNGGDGIRLDGGQATPTSSYRGNTVTNAGGTTIVGGVSTGANSCNGLTFCP